MVGHLALSTVTGSLLWRLPSDTIDDIRPTFAVTALSDGTSVIAGILLILIIRAVEQRAEARAAALGLGRTAMLTWAAPGAGAPRGGGDRRNARRRPPGPSAASALAGLGASTSGRALSGIEERLALTVGGRARP